MLWVAIDGLRTADSIFGDTPQKIETEVGYDKELESRLTSYYSP